jgi:hypothetical protein
MGDHKDNPQALFNASLPSLMPMGEPAGVEFQVVVMPRERNPRVLLRPAKDIGENGTKVRMEGSDEWIDTPEGCEVFELGKPLPPDKCDAVIVLGTAVAAGKIKRRISHVGHVPFHRIPLDQFRAEHAANLGEESISLTH